MFFTMGRQEKSPAESIDSVITRVKLNPETPHYVVNFLETSQSYCVGLVDIVNSTKISASLTSKKLSRYYEVFLNSMAQIIEKFGGYVIKNIGDSLLFYFPEPSKSFQGYDFKNCLECGLAINYRISADYGEVSIMKTNDSSSIDVFGTPVNMCTKINRAAPKNSIVIGGDLYRSAKKLDNYNYSMINSYSAGLKFMYPIYSVKRKN